MHFFSSEVEITAQQPAYSTLKVIINFANHFRLAEYALITNLI